MNLKTSFYLFVFIVAFFSCKKKESYNPDADITYEHWYKLNDRSLDTLFSVYFPNTFTPNGDGLNDVFIAKGYFKMVNFSVYDRNDKLIFETTDKNKFWDGRVGSSAQTIQMGTFVFRLTIKDIYNEEYEYKGSVILFK